MPIIYLNKTRIQNYFCPEDHCGDKIEKELEKAKTNIYFLQFSFTHNAIANKLIKKLHQGVEVKGVFEKRNAANKYSKYKLLEFQ